MFIIENLYIDYYESPVGVIEVTSDFEYIKSIDFVDKVHIKNPNEITSNCIKQLDEYFKGIRKSFDLELKLEGTEFQLKVWNELKNIPYGETVSYKHVATNINNEKAVRAVGLANSKNKIAIVIPCHRVIGANKKLVGYAGGLDKKEWLLNHENKFLK